jgi:hypothetical protein
LSPANRPSSDTYGPWHGSRTRTSAGPREPLVPAPPPGIWVRVRRRPPACLALRRYSSLVDPAVVDERPDGSDTGESDHNTKRNDQDHDAGRHVREVTAWQQPLTRRVSVTNLWLTGGTPGSTEGRRLSAPPLMLLPQSYASDALVPDVPTDCLASLDGEVGVWLCIPGLRMGRKRRAQNVGPGHQLESICAIDRDWCRRDDVCWEQRHHVA